MSEYESDSDSGAEPIKYVDNTLLHRQPDARVQVEWLDSRLHLVNIYIFVDSSILFLWGLNTVNMVQAGVYLLVGLFIGVTAVQEDAFYLYPTWQCE